MQRYVSTLAISASASRLSCLVYGTRECWCAGRLAQPLRLHSSALNNAMLKNGCCQNDHGDGQICGGESGKTCVWERRAGRAVRDSRLFQWSVWFFAIIAPLCINSNGGEGSTRNKLSRASWKLVSYRKSRKSKIAACGSEFKDSQLSREALKNQLAEHVAETETLKSELSKVTQPQFQHHRSWILDAGSLEPTTHISLFLRLEKQLRIIKTWRAHWKQRKSKQSHWSSSWKWSDTWVSLDWLLVDQPGSVRKVVYCYLKANVRRTNIRDVRSDCCSDQIERQTRLRGCCTFVLKHPDLQDRLDELLRAKVTVHILWRFSDVESADGRAPGSPRSEKWRNREFTNVLTAYHDHSYLRLLFFVDRFLNDLLY